MLPTKEANIDIHRIDCCKSETLFSEKERAKSIACFITVDFSFSLLGKDFYASGGWKVIIENGNEILVESYNYEMRESFIHPIPEKAQEEEIKRMTSTDSLGEAVSAVCRSIVSELLSGREQEIEEIVKRILAEGVGEREIPVASRPGAR